jgi:diguanylate cyclase (GGDEF)-like protein
VVDEQPRETAGLTIRLILEYVRRQTGESGVREVLSLAGETRPLEVLEDERVWSSYEAKIRLFEAAADVTGQPDVGRRVGEVVLDTAVGSTVRLLVGMFGSPTRLLKAITRTNSKFSTAAHMSVVELRRTSAVLRYRLRPGYRLSRHDCDYTAGLLSQVSAVFGLPPAQVGHDTCQVDGAEACIYRLDWAPRTWRERFRRKRVDNPAVMGGFLQERLRELQQTVADLVSVSDTELVLARIAARASSAVAAQRFLLVTRAKGDDVRVHADGFDHAQAEAVAQRLLDEVETGVEGHALVAPVRSATKDYGWLAAFGQEDFIGAEADLLNAYARLAASALDTATALAAAESARLDAEERRHTAEVLLTLSRSLLGVQSVVQLAQLMSDATCTVVGADVACVMQFDDSGALRVAGHSGYPEALHALLDSVVVRPEDTPELGLLLAAPDEPRFYTYAHDDDFLRRLLGAFGTPLIVLVGLHSAGRLHGILVAGWLEGTPLPEVDGTLLARLAGLADQATTALERTTLVEEVHRQAMLDPLTGLANRRLFSERLSKRLGRRRSDWLAVLFLDLDRFKVVNDTLGHSAGDDLLRQAADRLRGSLRDGDLVARLGGDEFTVLVSGTRSEVDVQLVADRILEAFHEPMSVAGHAVYVRTSIGAVVVPPGAAAVDTVLRDADAAMYAAKQAGGGRFVVFDPSRFGADTARLTLEADLHQAIALDALSVSYQPQVDLATGAVVGVEALARWRHPTRGELLPDVFLPLAEETGLLVQLDLQVLRRACTEVARWHRDGLPMRVAVNISARTLTDDTLLASVEEALADSGLAASFLELELTEAAAVQDSDKVLEVIDALHVLGVSVAVDDLGTGYSTLSWIRAFPVDRIKIDRTFVADLDADGPGASVVEAIVNLTQGLGCAIIAEGVETQTQVDRLLALGCAHGQGYLFAEPQPAGELTAWLEDAMREDVGAAG